MTQAEFTQWLVMHKQLFPSVADWLAARGTAQPVVLDAWFRAVSHIRLATASKVTADMVAGIVKHPDRWSIELLPAAICAACPPRIPSIEEATRDR